MSEVAQFKVVVKLSSTGRHLYQVRFMDESGKAYYSANTAVTPEDLPTWAAGVAAWEPKFKPARLVADKEAGK